MNNKRYSLPIGVFDSGVGGLTVYTVLQTLFPNEDFVYIGDTLNNPYGVKSDAMIAALSSRIVQYLENVPVKLAVIACNTITVAAFDSLQKEVSFPLVGMGRGISMALAATKNQCIAVMATEATIRSHKHRDELLAMNSLVKVVEVPCPTLAHIIEQGHIEDEVLEIAIKPHMKEIIDSGADTVILGCTHYPFIIDQLIKVGKELCPKQKITFINPAYEMSEAVKHILDKNDLHSSTIGSKQQILFTKILPSTTTIVEKVLPRSNYTVATVTL